ncbi:MAG TPA: cytochrome C [Oxalobacteraceae bacterium]|nr:cytochrome C [Oxalobacteraceae bacterium]
MESTRTRAILRQARDIQVPSNLTDAQLIVKGAGQYATMCANCHLAPGLENTETRSGLYPQPPNLSTHQMDPKATFWVTKHGIKMSGMPAWGLTHDDDTIWSMVAFINKLPQMSPQQYQEMVAKAEPHDAMHGPDAHGHSPGNNSGSGNEHGHNQNQGAHSHGAKKPGAHAPHAHD